MLQAVQDPKSGKVIDLTGPHQADARLTMEMLNTLAALERHHGRDGALIRLGEAFASAFALIAQRSGSSVAWQYAIEVALRNAFERAAYAPIDPPSGPVAA